MVVIATTRSVACNPATLYLEAGYQNSPGSVQFGVNDLSSFDHPSSSSRKRAEKENMLRSCVFFYYSLGDKLIIHYYDLGYSYNEILGALLRAHGICNRWELPL